MYRQRAPTTNAFCFHSLVARTVTTYQDLLVLVAGRDSPRILQQSIAQGTLSMIDMRHDAKVSVAFDWDRCDASLQLSRRSLSRFRGSSVPAIL